MGLIKAALSAVSGELQSQWLDAIKCEDMDMDTLMVKKTGKKGIISKGSRVIVGPGQIAVLYDSGKILDATAEPGGYEFDSSSSPSFFSGDFGGVFKDMWTRFTYNGDLPKEQAVFFINAKEIMGNKFGTPSPVDFPDFGHVIPNQMTGEMTPLGLQITCFGTYTYKITDPALFMEKYAGTGEVVTKEVLNDQMRSEVLEVLQNVLNSLGSPENKVSAQLLQSQTEKIKEIMAEKVYDEPIRKRGIQIESFVIEKVTLTDESKGKITEYEHNANSMMQQGRVLDVMEKAAGNAGGAANGFLGVGMMNMASGGMGTAVMQNAFTNQNTAPATETPKEETKEETNQEENTTEGKKFCTNCGSKIDGAKFCPNCGTKVE